MWTIELDLISKWQPAPSTLQSAATWLSCGLHIEEASITLKMDCKMSGLNSTELHRLVLAHRAEHLFEASTFLRNAVTDVEEVHGNMESEGEDEGDLIEDCYILSLSSSTLPLPSTLGWASCDQYGIVELVDQELLLWTGQANDALHAIRLALVDKVILFWCDVRQVESQVTNTQAWRRIKSVDAVLRRYVTIYRKCRSTMVSLGAEAEVLQQYQALSDADLWVTTSVLNLNGSGHRNENLAWFWSMDIPWDTDVGDRMSECKQSDIRCCYIPLICSAVYCINWLQAKAVHDR